MLIRSQYEIPADYEIMLGHRTTSRFPGYDDLPITFSHAGKEVKFPFLLSHDGSRLARLQEFDLSKDHSAEIRFDTRQSEGDPSAKITIVVFDDLACPFCARQYADLFLNILNRYKNLVRIACKDFPLVEIHPWALHAAINAECLAAQSTKAYWNYVGRIHAHYTDFSGDRQRLPNSFEQLDELAKAVSAGSVNEKMLNACIKTQDETAVRASMAEGERLGVSSTPAIFVNGEPIVGARSISWLSAAIDRALRREGLQPPAPMRTG